MKIKKVYCCTMCEMKQCTLEVIEEDERFFDEDAICCPFTPNDHNHGFSEIRREIIDKT